MAGFVPDVFQKVNSQVNWFVVYTKPLQEARASSNLLAQGFEAFLPVISLEKFRAGRVSVVVEPLFSRYMFVRLDVEQDNWGRIRSTLGVVKLLTMGGVPVPVPEGLVEALIDSQHQLSSGKDRPYFKANDAVQFIGGPLRGLKGVFEQHDGEARAMVLIDILSRPQRVLVQAEHLVPASL